MFIIKSSEKTPVQNFFYYQSIVNISLKMKLTIVLQYYKNNNTETLT